MRVLVVANCQGRAVSQILNAHKGINADYLAFGNFKSEILTQSYLEKYDVVVAQPINPDIWDRISTHKNVITFPSLLFFGFHPDQISITARSAAISVPWHNVSRTVVCAWRRNKTIDEAVALFNPEFMDAMRYHSDFEFMKQEFLARLKPVLPSIEHLFSTWYDRDLFFFAGHHPQSFVIGDVLQQVLKGSCLEVTTSVTDFFPDPLKQFAIIPALTGC